MDDDELRIAEEMYALKGIPCANPACMSVEGISATILLKMELQELGPG